MTFSLVACDLEARQWGVAVASKFPCVGAVVPWVRGDVGAIATQAAANVSYGPDGLERLAAGSSAQAALDALIGADEGNDERQLGIVDAHGGSATHTGAHCMDWAGGRAGLRAGGSTPKPARRWSTRFDTFAATGGSLQPTGWRPRCCRRPGGRRRRGRRAAALVVRQTGAGHWGTTTS
jgi:uncharacterized Ntn-hydrolase superfamily protein